MEDVPLTIRQKAELEHRERRKLLYGAEETELRDDGAVHRKSLRVLCIGVIVTLLVVSGGIAAVVLTSGHGTPLDYALQDTNTDANPCENFYDYSCGGWISSFEPPTYVPIFVRSFSHINEYVQSQKKMLLLQQSSDLTPLGKMYISCMDTTALDAAGYQPIQTYLTQISSVSLASQLPPVVALFMKEGLAEPFFKWNIQSDPINPGRTVYFNLKQGGLVLPRTFYIDESTTMTQLRALYKTHIQEMFQLIGIASADALAQAADVVALETSFAQVQVSTVELKNITADINIMTAAQLASTAPGFDWASFITSLGFPQTMPFNVMTPKYMTAMASVVSSASITALQAYLRWQLLHHNAPYLSQAIRAKHFELLQHAMGQAAPLPRDLFCVDTTQKVLGDDLDQLFLNDQFPPEKKNQTLTAVSAMVRGISDAFMQAIRTSTWLDGPTQTAALRKLAEMGVQLGQPSPSVFPRNYTNVVISSQFFANMVSGFTAGVAYKLAQVGNPLNTNLWEMSPTLANAYYTALTNTIVIPFGIMMQPMFDVSSPEALNYGGLGAVLGHEMTHGFDDVGRLFNGRGLLDNWWTAGTEAQFVEKSLCVEHFYDSLGGRGNKSLSENIADMGGIKLAYNAYLAYLQANPYVQETVSYTNEQLFFLAYGQNWCTKQSSQAAAAQAAKDVHSTGALRVMGPVANDAAFASAYKCPTNSTMNPVHRCSVW